MANHHPEQPPMGEVRPSGAGFQADRLQSAWADYQYLESEFFSGSDETNTVRATVDRGNRLVKVHIEDGLLRQGSETVEQRLNDALQNANAAAAKAIVAQREKLLEAMGLTPEVIGKLDSVIANRKEQSSNPVDESR